MFKLVIMLVACPLILFAQSEQKEIKVVDSFVNDAFTGKKNFDQINEQYFTDGSKQPISPEKRTAAQKKLLDSLVSSNREALSKQAYTVVPYEQVKGAKVFFRKTDHIYAVTTKTGPLFYVYCVNGKIQSFIYLTKAGEGYFLII